MKKTLAAVAVLGAFAGSALAADVTLYGKVDLGVRYVHSDEGGDKSDTWGLKSGGSSSSRWGLKGSEQISEGLTVGFQLESGFNADDGDDQEDKLFRRESRLYVATDYGTLHMGRFGALDSATGSVDMAAGMSAAGTGYGDYIANQGLVMHTNSRLNNSIAYTSPEFAGIKIAAMASLGDDKSETKYPFVDKDGNLSTSEKYDGTPVGTKPETTKLGSEGSSDVDRYYALGAKGQWGALGAGVIVSTEDFANHTEDNSMNVTAGVNYDFGVAKVFLAANYYDTGVKNEDAWGTVVSVAAPVAGGSMEVSAGYGVETAVEKNKEVDTDKMFVGGFYKYPLSKRTYVYTAAGYYQEEPDGGDKNKYVEAMTGICHNF